MTLTIQGVSLLVSFTMGILEAWIESIVNRLFYSLKNHLLRYVIECILMVALASGYLLVLVRINDGQVHYSMIICYLVGVIVYERVLAHYCLFYFEKIMHTISYIFRGIYFIFTPICAIFKVIKEGLNHEKSKEKKKIRCF